MKITHGKMFRTRAGKYGCYKYHNGKKHSFVTSKSKPKFKKHYSNYRRKSYANRRY